jgi:hypothetical protein
MRHRESSKPLVSAPQTPILLIFYNMAQNLHLVDTPKTTFPRGTCEDTQFKGRAYTRPTHTINITRTSHRGNLDGSIDTELMVLPR